MSGRRLSDETPTSAAELKEMQAKELKRHEKLREEHLEAQIEKLTALLVHHSPVSPNAPDVPAVL